MSATALKYRAADARLLTREVERLSGQNLSACYQCRRCAAGCPVGAEAGVTPDKLIRMVLLGDREAALDNLLVWRCVACYTCGTRCPNSIHTSRITEALKYMSKKAGLRPALPDMASFHAAFVESTARFGRVNEMDFMRQFQTEASIAKLKDGRLSAFAIELLGQMGLGLKMLMKKRMHLHMSGEKVSAMPEIKRIFDASAKGAK